MILLKSLRSWRRWVRMIGADSVALTPPRKFPCFGYEVIAETVPGEAYSVIEPQYLYENELLRMLRKIKSAPHPAPDALAAAQLQPVERD